MRTYLRYLIGIVFILPASCEKSIDLEMPIQNNLLVVEGRIESGQPPFVILTTSAAYFETTGINTFLNSFVHNAKVSIKVDNVFFNLPELCTKDIPVEFRPVAAAFLGIPVDQLSANNYCLYTVSLADLISNNFIKGIPGKTYELIIEANGKKYFSSSKIPEIVSLDSVRFELYGADTSFGFAWARLSDPDTAGNCYRWFARRINLGSYGQVKDETFVPPFGSSFDDKFFNGTSFDFAFDRGNRPSEEGIELPGEKQHFFKKGDTIVVKFCTTDKKVREFMKKYEAEIWNNENPFASPSTLPTNIEGGGLGLWAGYGVSFDTIFSKP